MALTFLPSLQHLATVKVALTIYNAEINNHFEKFDLMKKVYEEGSFSRICSTQETWVSKKKMKANKKLSKLLPKSLANKITNIFQPLVDEVNLWFRDHFYIMKHIEKSHYTSSLSWKSEGTIDRTNTAEKLVRILGIDKRVRFAVACIYFRVNDIQILWQCMTKNERRSILRIDSNIAVQIWLRWLRGSGIPRWTRCVTEFLRSEYHNRHIHSPSRVRLSSFFSDLNTSDKRFFLDRLWPHHAHADDLRLCYNQLDETERAEIFQSVTNTKNVLFCYLHWPLQSLFSAVVDQVRRHLTSDCSAYTFSDILFKKLMRGMRDFNYLGLLRDFWTEIPDTDKEVLRTGRLFTAIREAMSYDEKPNSLPIEELLMEIYQSQVFNYFRLMGNDAELGSCMLHVNSWMDNRLLSLRQR